MPQFFSASTFESQRLTQDGATVDPSDGLRHGNVRIGEPRAPVLRFSSRSLLVHNPVYPGVSCLGWGWDSDMNAKDRHMFFSIYFAALWDNLDVAAQSDCSSAIKPKVQLSERMVDTDGGLVSAGTESLTRCRGNLGTFSFSIFLHCCVRFCGIFFVLRGARQVETFAACSLDICRK